MHTIIYNDKPRTNYFLKRGDKRSLSVNVLPCDFSQTARRSFSFSLMYSGW